MAQGKSSLLFPVYCLAGHSSKRITSPPSALHSPRCQVLRLCEAHKLHTALTYVYNKILEYRRPLVVLLAAVALGVEAGHPPRDQKAIPQPPPLDFLSSPDVPIAAPPPSSATPIGLPTSSRAACYKLLVYVRCVFRGFEFPPRGSKQATRRVASSAQPAMSSLDASSDPRAQVGYQCSPLLANYLIFRYIISCIRPQVLGSLLFMEASDLEREWGIPSGQLGIRTGISGPHPALQVIFHHYSRNLRLSIDI